MPLTHKHVAVAVIAGMCLAPGAALFRSGPTPTPAPGASRRPPDIVLATIDALRADHVSAYGYRRLTSPAIDRLAARSRVFTNATTQAPYTKAAIASLMSGLYPSAHKAVTVTVSFTEAMTGRTSATLPSTDVLLSTITTLAETLHDAGYRTLGFNANPFLLEAFGFGQGFDVFKFFPGAEFATVDRLVDEALTAIEHTDSRPVFLWVHMMEPHSPYDPPDWADPFFLLDGSPHPIPDPKIVPSWLVPGTPTDLRIYERNYDSEIAVADAGVDTLLRGVRQARPGRGTVTVITADHGEQFLDHGGLEHNTTLYEELINVPLVINAPGLGAGVIDTPVELVDVYPTLLGIAGVGAKEDLTGQDLREVIAGAPHEPVYSENPGNQTAVRAGDWKLIRNPGGREELYNLRKDPRESVDLSQQQPERTAALRALIADHAARSADRGRGIKSERAPLDPTVIERLRALGYLGR